MATDARRGLRGRRSLPGLLKHLCLVLSALSAALIAQAEVAADGRMDATRQINLAGLDLSCARCNIILLNIELLRADYVGILSGSHPSDTPNIDRFFSHALMFEDVSAPAGESYRSNLAVQTAMNAFHFRASEKEIQKFVGRYDRSSYNQANQRVAEMLTRYPAMAEYFQAGGFHTVSMNQGVRAGKHLLLDRGFDEVINWSRQRISYIKTVDELVAKLKAEDRRPFLIHYRPEVLHPFPYYYPDSRPVITAPGEIFNHHRPRFARYNVRFRPSLSKERRREVHHRIYRQQVQYMDDELGRVFSTIKAMRLDESSVIVLYSNHGSGLGDNGVDKLAVSYQSCIHVPLLILHPGLDRAVRITAPVALIDLVPTLLDISGLTIASHFDGASLLREPTGFDGPLPYLTGRNDYDEYVREGNLKLIVKNGKLLELYNVSKDPAEAVDLSDKLPAEVRRLKAALEEFKLSVLQEDNVDVASPE